MSLVLHFSDWPAADRAMWHDLFKSCGPLDDGGQLAHLRQTSRDVLEKHYGRWLGWLADTAPSVLTLPSAERATVERLLAWRDALSHTRPMSQMAFVSNTVRLLRAAGPEMNWEKQQRLVKHLKRQAGRGDPARKAGRVLDSQVLLKAGIRYATLGAEQATTSFEALKRRRDGTMIAFLAALPIRRRAFCGLTIDTSTYVMPDSILVSLPESLTKTGVPWEASVPASVDPLLRAYLDEVRPNLMARGGCDHDVFWVSNKGSPYQLNHFGHRVGKITMKLIGVRVTPHLFRDAAATTLSRLSPEAARLIPPVLAHSSNRTAEQHYIHAGSIDAGRNHAALIQNLKSRAW